MKPGLLVFFIAYTGSLMAQTTVKSADSIPGGTFQVSVTYLKNIMDFTVQRLSSGKVLACWHTHPDSQDKGFVLERKKENEPYFVPVGFVPSKTSSDPSLIQDYLFSDKNNYKGVSYYRIKQTDSRGRSYFTSVKKIKGMKEN